MKRRRVDRRALRTRALLHETMMAMLLTRPYESITVAEICQLANVGRSTFYVHYDGKDELMRAGLELLRAALLKGQEEQLATSKPPKRFGFARTLLEYVHDHRVRHPALAGGGAVDLSPIREIVSDLVREELSGSSNGGRADANIRSLSVQFVVGALMSVLSWWLDTQSVLSAQEVDAIFRRLITEGVAPPLAANQKVVSRVRQK